MNESFDLPVTYNGQEFLFPARLRHLGYTHVFVVDVHGQEILFEPDEEQHYRAIIDPENMESKQKTDVELLKTIASTIETVIKQLF